MGSDSLVIVVTPVVTDDLVARLLRLSNQGITAALILPDGLKPEAISKRLIVSGLPAYYAHDTVQDMQGVIQVIQLDNPLQVDARDAQTIRHGAGHQQQAVVGHSRTIR